MNKRYGFTLIELLAVIVILAIIALIATPIVMSIIDGAKNESNKRSVEAYYKAINNSYLQYKLNNGNRIPLWDDINNSIEYNGVNVSCETHTVSENGVYINECSVNGTIVMDKNGNSFYQGIPNWKYANMSKEQIDIDEHIYPIGRNNKYNIIAVFNDDYTSVEIKNNTIHSDGKIMNWARNVEAHYSTGAATYSGGAFYQEIDKQFYTEVNPFYLYRGRLQNIIIDEGITEFGEWIFSYCEKIITVPTFPNTLRKINYRAFYKCNAMTGTLVIPNSVTNIGEYAFSGCASLTGTLAIPNSVVSIESGAFNGCKLLTDLVFENNSKLETIGDYAFNYMEALEANLVIPNSVKYIGIYAFASSSKLKSLTLNEGLLWIGDFAFEHEGNSGQTSITIPSTVKQIGGRKYTENTTNKGVNPFYDNASSSITEFKVAEGNTNYKAVDGVLYTMDEKVLVSYPSRKNTITYTLLDNCETAFATSFSRSRILTTLVLSDSFVVEDASSWYTHDKNYLNNTNNLSAAFYKYTTIKNITVNATNTRYIAKNGLLLSKDSKTLYYVPTQNSQGSTLTLPDVSTMYIGAIISGSYGATTISIPASLIDIQGSGITDINSTEHSFKNSKIIDSNNPKYTVSNNNIILK